MSVQATYSIEVDWNNNGLFDHAYSNIYSYVLSTDELTLGRASDTKYDEPGKGQWTLNNSTGIFSKKNSSSPIYGLIVKDIRVRHRMTYSSTVTIWQGHLKGIDEKPGRSPNRSEDRAIMRAMCPLGHSTFDEGDVDVATQSSQRPDQCMTNVLDAKSWPAGDRSLDTGCLTTMLRWWPDPRVRPLDVMRQLQDMEGPPGRLRSSRDGKIIFDARDHIYNAPHNTAQATYGTGTLGYKNIKELESDRDVFDVFIGQYITYYKTPSATEIITVTDVENDKGGDPPFVEYGQTVTIWVELSGRYKAVESLGSVTKKAFTNKDGMGTDLTSFFTVTPTAYGARIKLAIQNTHGSLNGYLTKCIIDGIALIFGDTTEARSGSGERRYPYPGKYYVGPVELQDHADHAVALFGVDRTRLQFEVPANLDANHMAEVRDREHGDRIEVTASGADTGLYISATDFIIDKITHRIPHPSKHTMIVTASKAPTDTLAATSVSYTIQETPDPEYLPEDTDLDDIPDGSTYARPKADGMTGGYFRLDSAEGDLDDIADSATRVRMLSTERTKLTGVETGADVTADHNQAVSWLTDGGACATADDLDDIADGSTYYRFLGTERTKLTGIETGADVTADHNQAVSWLTDAGACATADDMDDISDGSTYGRLRLDELSSGYINLTTNSVIDADVIASNRDPSSWDYSSFTADASWYDLDCSGEVPTGMRHILFRYASTVASTGRTLMLRKNGTSYEYAAHRHVFPGVGTWYGSAVVPCDSNRKIEYKLINSQTVYMCVAGYWP